MTATKFFRSSFLLATVLLVAFIGDGCTNSRFQVGNSSNSSSSSPVSAGALPPPGIFSSPTSPSAKGVLVGYGGRIMQTSDSGNSYPENAYDIPNGNDDIYNIRSITYANHLFVSVGYRIKTSSDGVTWTTTPSNFPTTTLPNWLGGAAYANGTWVLVGGCGTRYTSTNNGVTWSELSNDYISVSNGCGHLRGVVYGNKLFFAWGDSGITAVSPDGFNWKVYTPASAPVTYAQAVYAFGYFYAISNATSGQNVYQSVDGVNWYLSSGIQSNISNLTFTSNTLILSTSSGTIMKTTDGANWTNITPSTSISSPVYALSGGYITFGWCFTGVSTNLAHWTMTTLTSNCLNSLAVAQ